MPHKAQGQRGSQIVKKKRQFTRADAVAATPKGGRDFKRATVSGGGSSGKTFAGITPKPTQNFTPANANFQDRSGVARFIPPSGTPTPTATGETTQSFTPTGVDAQGNPIGVSTTSTPAEANFSSITGQSLAMPPPEGFTLPPDAGQGFLASIGLGVLEGQTDPKSKQFLDDTFGQKNMERFASTISTVALTVLGGLGLKVIMPAVAGAYTATRTTIAGARAKSQARSVTRIAKMFKVPEGDIRAAIRKKGIAAEVNKVVRGFSVKKLALGGLTVGGLLGLASADTLTTWYALDNVLSGQKFYVKDLEEAVANGTLNAVDARAAIKDSQEVRQIARDKVNASVRYNPLMWPFKKLILAGVDADEAAIQLAEDSVKLVATQVEAGGVISTKAAFDIQASVDLASLKHEYELQETKYYNDLRLQTELAIIDARSRANVEDLAEWIAAKARVIQMETEAAIKRAALWLQFQKDKIEIAEQNAPSTLGFGLF